MPIGVYERTDKIRKALSVAAHRKFRQHPEFRKFSSQRMHKLWKNSAFRKRHAKRHRKLLSLKWANDEAYSRKMTVTARKTWKSGMKKNWLNPEFRKKMLNGKPSKAQMFLFRSLIRRGAIGLRLEFPVGRRSIDIAVPKKKIAIEVDGQFWHALRPKYDIRRDKFLRSRGWRIFHVNYSGPKDIDKFLRSKRCTTQILL